jgi:hypothetical protein
MVSDTSGDAVYFETNNSLWWKWKWLGYINYPHASFRALEFA